MVFLPIFIKQQVQRVEVLFVESESAWGTGKAYAEEEGFFFILDFLHKLLAFLFRRMHFINNNMCLCHQISPHKLMFFNLYLKKTNVQTHHFCIMPSLQSFYLKA